ncbi:sugar ABC transporter permease [Microbacterium sp. H37-C3]|uniref:carbohydrate ABC transporter permease n=2 Tax=Microbacterium TaxID=33882 RepID=UPI0022AE73AC|nr:sugar ABC transporter permease [Microbacterium sp. H37-C3]MCZ4068879.1 sugar ABC transporter permease [Microbacterium sp. H37-C3]
MTTTERLLTKRPTRKGLVPGGRGPAGPRGSLSPGRTTTMAALLAPSILLLVAINAYPLVFAIGQSLHDGGITGAGDFVGLENYATALQDPAFWNAAWFTLIFTVVSVGVSWIIGMTFALVLRNPFPGRSGFRLLLLLPWVVPVVVSTTSWNFLVATQSSPVPTLFRALGFGDVQFLADPTWAMITVIVFKIWGSFPFMLLMMNAALQSVDHSVEEAARIDGATAWQKLRHIILPIIAKPIYISWVLAAIFTVNDFPTIYLLTGGGPVGATNTLVVFAYRLVFQDFRTGYGVAVAFLITIVIVAVSVYFFRRINRAPLAN